MTGGGVGPGTDGGPALAAVLCAGAAVCLLYGRDGPGRARLLLAAGGPTPTARGGPPGRRDALRRVLSRLLGKRYDRACREWGHHWWCLPGGVVLGVLAESPLPVLAGLAAVPVAGRWAKRRRAGAAAERREAAVIELCAAVAGELRAGRLPDAALLAAGAGALGEDGSAVLAAARYGGEVPVALRHAARRPGAAGLRGAAACWQVSADGGTGLADGLDRVAGALRAERDQREELRAQLAGPRATAAVLALLPVFGLLLGGAMGARPLQVLLHTPTGLGCLALGGLLEWAGLAWVARLVRTAEDGAVS